MIVLVIFLNLWSILLFLFFYCNFFYFTNKHATASADRWLKFDASFNFTVFKWYSAIESIPAIHNLRGVLILHDQCFDYFLVLTLIK